MFKQVFKKWKTITNSSINRQIASAAFTVGFLTIFVKLMAVIKDIVIAWKFGTSDELDAFFMALIVPDFTINLLVAASFSLVLVPAYVRTREQQGFKAAHKLFSGVMICALALLVITTILIVITAPLYLPSVVPKFDLKKLNLTLNLLYVISPFIILAGIINIWSGVLNAGERFALAALSPILTPSFSILILLSFDDWKSYALPISLVGGALLEVIILGLALRRQGIPLAFSWHGFDTNLREVIRQYLPTLAGALLICSANPIDQIMAATLSPGSVAALNYGNKVVASPMSLLTIALGTAAIPYFSKMIAFEDWNTVQKSLKSYLKIIFLTTIPLTIALIIFSKSIIQLLFQRGSFTSEDTFLVSQVQICYALQMPFYVANYLLIKLIASLRVNKMIAYISIINTSINVIGNYVLMSFLGVKGIALSTSCVYVISFLCLYFFANRMLHQNIRVVNLKDVEG